MNGRGLEQCWGTIRTFMEQVAIGEASRLDCDLFIGPPQPPAPMPKAKISVYAVGPLIRCDITLPQAEEV